MLMLILMLLLVLMLMVIVMILPALCDPPQLHMIRLYGLSHPSMIRHTPVWPALALYGLPLWSAMPRYGIWYCPPSAWYDLP